MAFTKVVGAGIHTLSNITSHNINSSGIITATKFVGPMENSSGISTFYDLKVTNNLTVEGTTTTLDTKLVEVDKIEVEADSTNVAIAVTQTGSGDLIRLYEGSTQRVTIDDEGNVGVGAGAATPHVPLHIRTGTTGAITTLLKLHGPFTSNTGSEGTAIDFGTAADTSIGARIIGTREAAGAKGALRFCTGRENDSGFNDGHMVIDETGNVGIGSAAPAALLNLMSTNPLIRLTDSDNSAYSAIGGESGNLYLYTNSTARDFIFRGTGEVARLTGDGKLGIGTHTPSAALHLQKTSGTALLKIENTNGTAHLDIRHTNGYGAVHYVHQGTEKWRVGQTAQADHFSIYQSTGAGGLPYRLFIQNNGEVGINTSDPEDTLHLLRDSVNHGIKLERGGTLPGTALVQVHSNGVLSLQGGNNIHYVSGGSQQHIWYRASTEIARFDTGGQLGIGTNAPGTKLDVRSGNWNNGDIVVGEPGSAGKIAFRRGNDGSNAAYIGYDGAENNSEVALAVNSGDGTILFKTNSQERVRIKSTGEVGIGTNSPSGLTHWVAPGDMNLYLKSKNATGTIRWNYEDSGGTVRANHAFVNYGNGKSDFFTWATHDGSSLAERVRITKEGKVGIGTDNPDALSSSANNLVIADFGGEGGMTIKTNVNSAGNIFFADADGSATGRIAYGHGATDAGDYMRFYVNSEERVRIRHDGKVGIGTNLSSSTYKLEVWDDTAATFMIRKGNASRMVFSNDSQHNTLYSQALPSYTARPFSVYIGSSEALRITSAGNVGIATNLSGGGGAYGRLGVVIPSQSGGSALQVMNSAVGSGDGSLTNIVLRSVNNLGTQWAGAEYRAQEHIFSNQTSERLKIDSSGHLLPGANTSQDIGENSSSRWRGIYGQTLSLTSYATIGAIVAADPGSNYYSYNNRIGSGLAVVGNSYVFNGQVGINTNGHMNGRVTIKNTNGFNSASISSNTDNIYLISNTTSSDGAYGASIGFSRVQYSDRRAAAITTVQEGSDEDFVGLSFWTHDNADATAAIVEKLRITPKGTTFVSSGTRPKNQCEAAHSGDETLGLMVKRSICFSDSDTKGQGMVMVSHTKSVPCDGTTSDMITIRNREGCFIGDVYAGYSAGGSAAVCHKKFHTYYNGSTLTNENTPAGRISESLDITASYNNDVHTFRVTPDNTNNVYQGGSTLNVTMSIIALSAGAAGSDNFTVTYH